MGEEQVGAARGRGRRAGTGHALALGAAGERANRGKSRRCGTGVMRERRVVGGCADSRRIAVRRVARAHIATAAGDAAASHAAADAPAALLASCCATSRAASATTAGSGCHIPPGAAATSPSER